MAARKLPSGVNHEYTEDNLLGYLLYNLSLQQIMSFSLLQSEYCALYA
jgi:hypothetical protein